ncbi:hypothetical protein [Prauserella cavernicola]|uniref:DUF2269 domain-containing protein n=1 Tax=Prauserella cavernicola TaxID=2800127 RepID=A0A934QSK3_9PSEU|nr:hypothetical protein [Prauserella cavernicola]MBK1785765.1 hypothetical protein [Prauserella cavernicola]
MATRTRIEPRLKLGRRPRKWLLFVHVVSSVGWIGIEACLLTLGIVGVSSGDDAVTSGAYVIAGVLGGTFYFPVSMVALISGLLLGIGTKWGLLRYHWVLAKLVLTIALYLGGNLLVVPRFVAAGEAVANGDGPGDAQGLLISAMTAGLVLLLVATLLSVFTPGGRTPWFRKRTAS